MPYKITKRGGRYAVTHGGKTFGTHGSKESAQRQVRAIYAHEKPSKKPKRKPRKKGR